MIDTQPTHAMFDEFSLNRLKAICNDDLFIARTADIVKQRGDRGRRNAEEAKAINKELDKVRKALIGLSDEALDIFLKCHSHNYNSDPVPEILDTLSWCNAYRADTKRHAIAGQAIEVFRDFHLQTTDSSTGEFTRYLDVIRRAAGIGYNSHKLARDIIKIYRKHGIPIYEG